MPDTNFVARVTSITALWLNEVNALTFKSFQFTLAGFRAVDSTKTQKVLLFGQTSFADIPPTWYLVDSSDTTSADNGSTIIVGADGARWKVVVREELDIRLFGVVGSGDETSKMQTAFQYAWDNGVALVFHNKTYTVTGLILAATSTTQDRLLELRGRKAGNPFASWTTLRGSTIKSTTNAPVLRITATPTTVTPGTIDIDGIIFDGTSTTPVVYLDSFYGISRITNTCVFQRGTGNGIQIDWMTTGRIENCYVLNSGWSTASLGAARTGIGIYIGQTHDSGLQKILGSSVRGWNTGMKIGVGSASAWTYAAKIEACEFSTVYNGLWLTNNARGSIVSDCYFEGGDGGVAILDEGDYNSVNDCFTFPGFSTHYKCDQFTYGNSCDGCVFSAGTTPNQTLASITSSGTFGGPGKSFTNNHLSFGGSGGSIAGVVGLVTSGLNPRINLTGTNFFPRGPWVGGAGTLKTNYAANNYGHSIGMNGEYELPYLSQGMLSFAKPETLTQADVISNTLTLRAGSFFDVTATAAATVNKVSAGGDTGRFVVLKTTNANMTFQNGAQMKLAAAANFTGPGTITFIIERAGGLDTAYEICRTTF